MSEGIQPHYFSRLMPQFLRGNSTPLHEVVATGPVDSASSSGLAELCWMKKTDYTDPHYLLFTSDGIYAQLGYTGLVSSLKELGSSGLSTIFQRKSGYGIFTRNGMPLSNTDATLVHGIDDVYTTISGLDFYEEEMRELFEWRAQQMLARFGEYSILIDESNIVPEYNDRMNVITVSKRCPRHCIYCPEAGNLELFTRDMIEGNMKLGRRMQEKYHGHFKSLMNEGFINSSDLLLFYMYRRKNPSVMDPVEIAQMFKAYFPEVTKLYTFVGGPTTNTTPLSYLRQLYGGGRLINRALIGIESGDESTSRFLGKNESNEDKAKAVRKLQNTGFKVKVIVQVGMTGKGFYDSSGTFHDSWQALGNTAEFLSKTIRPFTFGSRDKVLISRYVPIEGTPLKTMHEEGTVVVPFISPSELEEQVEWLTHELKKASIDVEAEYETALEGRVRLAA